MSVRQFCKISKAHADSIWCVSFHTKDSSQFVTGCVDGTAKHWKILGDDKLKEDEKGSNSSGLVQNLSTFGGHSLGVISVGVIPESNSFISSSMDSRLRIWDLELAELNATIDARPVECWTLSVNPSSPNLIATGTHNGCINIWEIENRTLKTTLDTKEGTFILSVVFSPDGSLIAAGNKDGKVFLFDMRTEKILATFKEHTKPIRALCFANREPFLLTGSDDMTVNIYDAGTREYIASVKGHLSWVLSIDCNCDDRIFATSSSDKKIKIWDLKTRECLHTFEAHTDQVYQVAFSKDGTRLVSVGGEGDIQLYTVSS